MGTALVIRPIFAFLEDGGHAMSGLQGGWTQCSVSLVSDSFP
jgi:hypothetical protein